VLATLSEATAEPIRVFAARSCGIFRAGRSAVGFGEIGRLTSDLHQHHGNHSP